MAKTGESVEISFVVSGDVGAVYPRAYLTQGDGTPISSVDLTHVSNGQYVGSFTMPAFDVFANYVVYSDAGRTTKDPLYNQDQEIIEHEDYVLNDINNSILAINNGENIEGTIDNDEDITGTISDGEELIGTVELC